MELVIGTKGLKAYWYERAEGVSVCTDFGKREHKSVISIVNQRHP